MDMIDKEKFQIIKDIEQKKKITDLTNEISDYFVSRNITVTDSLDAICVYVAYTFARNNIHEHIVDIYAEAIKENYKIQSKGKKSSE